MLLTDHYGAYDPVLDERLYPGRKAAACVAHARRKFDELAKAGTSAVGEEAIQRFAGIYAVERALIGLSDEGRCRGRRALARPLWEQLGAWLQLERWCGPTGARRLRPLTTRSSSGSVLFRRGKDKACFAQFVCMAVCLLDSADAQVVGGQFQCIISPQCTLPPHGPTFTRQKRSGLLRGCRVGCLRTIGITSTCSMTPSAKVRCRTPWGRA